METPKQDTTALDQQQQQARVQNANSLQTKMQQQTDDLLRMFAQRGAFANSFARPALLG